MTHNPIALERSQKPDKWKNTSLNHTTPEFHFNQAIKLCEDYRPEQRFGFFKKTDVRSVPKIMDRKKNRLPNVLKIRLRGCSIALVSYLTSLERFRSKERRCVFLAVDKEDVRVIHHQKQIMEYLRLWRSAIPWYSSVEEEKWEKKNSRNQALLKYKWNIQ